MKAEATFKPTKWDEKSYEQPSPHMKLTRTVAEYHYDGRLQGDGAVEYLMFYSSYDEHDPHKATAQYVGLISFKGTVDGRAGAFVFEDRGAFAAGAAKSSLRILPGSGTGQLAGISGTAASVATPNSSHFELDYRLPGLAADEP